MAYLLDRLKDPELQGRSAQLNEPVRAKLTHPNQANLQTRLNNPAIQGNAAEQAQALRGKMAKPQGPSNLQTRLNTVQAPGGRMQLKPAGNSAFKAPALANPVAQFGGLGAGVTGLTAAESIYGSPAIQNQMQGVSENIQNRFGTGSQNTLLGEMPTNARLFGDTTGQGSLLERIQGGLTDALYKLDPAGIMSNQKQMPALNQNNTDQTSIDRINKTTRTDPTGAGNTDNNTTRTPPALAKPTGPLNAFGNPVQNLTPSGGYMDQGVEVIPWDDMGPDVLSRLLPKDQFVDYMGQGNVAYDDEGNPTRTPMTLNPELDPNTKALKEQLVQAQIAKASQPKLPSFGMSDGTVYQSSGAGAQNFNAKLNNAGATQSQKAWTDFYDEGTNDKQKSEISKWLKANDPKGWLEYQSKRAF